MNEEKRQYLCRSMASALPVLRKAIGATQQELADILGVTRNTIIHMERSKTMGWPSYLSFLMIFSRNENTVSLIRVFDLYPAEVDDYLAGRVRAQA